MWHDFVSSTFLNTRQDVKVHSRCKSSDVITLLNISDFCQNTLVFTLICFATNDGFPWQHVREICHFDLTCPIRGVGPEVVRKLLLEDNLKIRGRKDSKVSRAGAPSYSTFKFISSEHHCHHFLMFPRTWCDAAGGGGSAFLRCASNDQSPEERRAAEGSSTSSGPRQDVLHSAERWLWVWTRDETAGFCAKLEIP